MGRKRGFFAELQHQAAVAERNRQRALAVEVREQARLEREAERARIAAERARAQAARSDAKAAAAAEKEAKRLQVAAQESNVESLNSSLELQLSEIDNILSATLDVDDYVDLEKLRKTLAHPPFASRHEKPIPSPASIPVPPEPVFVAPDPPKGMSAVFGKKKYAEAVANSRLEFGAHYQRWQEAAAAVPMKQLEQLNEHRKAEESRLNELAKDVAQYDEECRKRKEQVDSDNADLEELVRDLDAHKPDAVEEYLGIVFSNSVYPDYFPWPPRHRYDANAHELIVQLQFPSPEQIPTVRQYKYVKAKDEISATSQTQKEQRDRFTNLVFNMTLRTLHEVWESDRSGRIKTISFTGHVAHVDPATGKEVESPLVAVAAERDIFVELDLSRVTPAETLKHLNAVVSKNPHAVAPIDVSQGVRGH